MKKFFKNKWKHSKLRFYILNALWNYRFWLFAEKMYKTITYTVVDEGYDVDIIGKMIPKKKQVIKKRFVGYFYKNGIYLDNPGLQGIDDETRKVWKKKGLIKPIKHGNNKIISL